MAAEPPEELNTWRERETLARSLERGGIHDQRVLRAIRSVPRHQFVPQARHHQAYRDEALAIEQGQTISQPTVVAEMTQALAPNPAGTVLEIGTGSGYQTAILCELFRHVYSVERDETLSRQADRRLKRLGYFNYSLKVGDGTDDARDRYFHRVSPRRRATRASRSRRSARSDRCSCARPCHPSPRSPHGSRRSGCSGNQRHGSRIHVHSVFQFVGSVSPVFQ